MPPHVGAVLLAETAVALVVDLYIDSLLFHLQSVEALFKSVHLVVLLDELNNNVGPGNKKVPLPVALHH